MCGEQAGGMDDVSLAQGSPPRVRGTDKRGVLSAYGGGITPACAGNSGQDGGAMMISKDHPRVCGEQLAASAARRMGAGSPPRVRGTGIRQCGYIAPIRITPACAGNSRLAGEEKWSLKDHPRVCGEQSWSCKWNEYFIGSPPRVRGTVRLLSKTSIIGRITPACAGNRLNLYRPSIQTGDHPRVCGEQICSIRRKPICEGSPPRVRGTGRCHSEFQDIHGITPACAGNRSLPGLSFFLIEDHPRVCGEQ